MVRHRFYAPPSSFDSNHILLDASESHHVRNVLRLHAGASLHVFDGSGAEYTCRLEGFEGNRARLTILERTEPVVESPLRITLAQGLTQGEKFDLIVQKATELGVDRIVPLMTAHTVSRGRRSVSQQRVRRWRRIALEATKQCGRTRLTEVTSPVRLEEFLADLCHPTLLFSRRGGCLPVALPLTQGSGPRRCCLMVGPEGGWAGGEVDAARAAGAVEVSLGPRVLRTETAAIVAVSLVQHCAGDLK